MANLGIDVAKNKFDVALLKNEKYKSKSFNNKPSGYIALLAWMKLRDPGEIHVCLEATGAYGDQLAKFLFENGYTVSVVNPSRVKAFGEAELLRNKNDKIDAKLLARFCEKMNPAAWQPDPPEIEHLRMLGRRRRGEDLPPESADHHQDRDQERGQSEEGQDRPPSGRSVP